jgi:uncharacterized membrane protein
MLVSGLHGPNRQAMIPPMSDYKAYDLDGTSVVLRPNRSLPVAGLLALFAGLTTLVMSVGVVLAFVGAWLVLVFAVLEVIGIGVLCLWCYRRLDDCEWVVIGPRRVAVVRRDAGRESRFEFSRPWVRLILDRGRDPYSPSRLSIGSHGRLVQLAESCSEVDRLFLAHELRNALRLPSYIR